MIDTGGSSTFTAERGHYNGWNREVRDIDSRATEYWPELGLYEKKRTD